LDLNVQKLARHARILLDSPAFDGFAGFHIRRQLPRAGRTPMIVGGGPIEHGSETRRDAPGRLRLGLKELQAASQDASTD
jgi:hypothetical protein